MNSKSFRILRRWLLLSRNSKDKPWTEQQQKLVGKGRDFGLNQIALFEGKVTGGTGDQVRSRDVYRLGKHFHFFRMCSFFFTTVGYSICTPWRSVDLMRIFHKQHK